MRSVWLLCVTITRWVNRGTYGRLNDCDQLRIRERGVIQILLRRPIKRPSRTGSHINKLVKFRGGCNLVSDIPAPLRTFDSTNRSNFTLTYLLILLDRYIYVCRSEIASSGLIIRSTTAKTLTFNAIFDGNPCHAFYQVNCCRLAYIWEQLGDDEFLVITSRSWFNVFEFAIRDLSVCVLIILQLQSEALGDMILLMQ